MYNGITNIEVKKAFLTKELATLDEAREVARLNKVISNVKLASPLGRISSVPGDVRTQTYQNRPSYNRNGHNN